MRKKLHKIKFQLIFILIIALLGVGLYWNAERRTYYDFTHLTQRVDYGEGREFAPVAGVTALAAGKSGEMLPVADNAVLTLYIDPLDSNFAVLDKRNGHIWHSSPPGVDADMRANSFEKGIMRSLFGFRYYDEQRRRFTKWSYQDGAENEQFTLESIPNGVRILYEIGDTSLGIDACPRFIEAGRFEERFLSRLENPSDVRFLSQRAYQPSRTLEGFVEMPSGMRTNAVNIERMLAIFEELEYTLEELMEDNEAAGYEMEVELDFFAIQLEIILNDDTLTLNLPLDKIETSGEENLFFMEIMKYFGAGANDEEGYILVPAGSGGLIDFNNGKINEETFISAVYDLDPIMNVIKPQITEPVRLPVFGIKKDNAAVVAWLSSGNAMATVNADVAGKINSYNIAWYTFLLRDHMMMTMAGGSETDMTIVQQQTYDGDITLHYRFIANEDANYTGMALAYQRALIEDGTLTPLAPAENTPFYLSIIGGVDKTKFILGTPYTAIEPMTTYKEANEILDILNHVGVHNINMRWLGWFNRGVNHDVAKKINWTRSVGSKDEMRGLNDRLKADGGGFYPSVNFQMTAWATRNLTRSYEVARDPAGFQGMISNVSREFLRTTNSRYNSDWFLIIHPGVLPFHIDKFIPAYNKLGIDNLALYDLGDVLSESIYRKNTVDREHSRLIAAEQLERLGMNTGSIMISGGNDYALSVADHIIDAPIELDRYYLVDHEVPFYQIVMHGFMDYAGRPVNTREVQDVDMATLNMLATGAAPHYLWSYQPTRQIEFTPYERYYSTQYENWMGAAAEQYRLYNEIYKDLRTLRITGHEILSESSSHTSAVTVTEFENGTRIYVNTTRESYLADGYMVPAMGYYVHRGGQ
jgi:hypothetical protein